MYWHYIIKWSILPGSEDCSSPGTPLRHVRRTFRSWSRVGQWKDDWRTGRLVHRCQNFLWKVERASLRSGRPIWFGWHVEQGFMLLTVWPDMAKFRYFGKVWRTLAMVKGLFNIRENIEPTLANVYEIWQIFVVVNGQILNKQPSYLVVNWFHSSMCDKYQKCSFIKIGPFPASCFVIFIFSIPTRDRK